MIPSLLSFLLTGISPAVLVDADFVRPLSLVFSHGLEWHAYAPLVLDGFESGARELIEGADGPWQYLLVFVFAATPLLEILVVIPIGVALGLDPVSVALVAFAGNVLPIYAIVVGFDRLSRWLAARGEDAGAESARRARARRLLTAYGLPGLALVAPVATGVHLAAILAIGFGSSKRATLGWMTASITLWTIAITVASVTGTTILLGS